MEGSSWCAVEENWNPALHATMHKHWKRYGPPVYMSVAAYMGVGKVGESKKQGDLGELMRKFAGNGGRIN